jgi:serine/threonine protein kinase
MPEIGQQISHYRILQKIGQGGMGEVFLAYDTSLDRKVAVKFLPEFLGQDETAHKRFIREARSAAALNHPYICSIHEVGEFKGNSFIVMEYLEGITLKDRLAQGEVPLKEAVQWAVEIAEALSIAHEKAIVHRDLKPSNIMLSRTGHVQVMDFGLAKQLSYSPESGSQEETLTALTGEGTTVGTIPYMSPEQVQGKPVDHRSDLFSFGIIIYEMLTGINPFKRESGFNTAEAIRRESPAPLSKYRDDVPQHFKALVGRLLTKEPEGRSQQAREVAEELKNAFNEISGEQIVFSRNALAKMRKTLTRPVYLIPLIIIFAGIAYFSVKGMISYQKENWAREKLLPEIEQLVRDISIQSTNSWAAYELATQAEQYIPDDPVLQRLMQSISHHVQISSNPTGASVYAKPYSDIALQWHYMGQTAAESIRLPVGLLRIRLEKEGHRTVNDIAVSNPMYNDTLRYTLPEAGSIPEDMEFLPETEVPTGLNMPGLEHLPGESVGNYLMDRHEITNREFKRFVDSGGYENPAYWKYAFVKNSQTLSWNDAMLLFTDKTDRPGPAAWEVGDYPDGQDEYPVAGVSWYEAAAYAEFVNKSLPISLEPCCAYVGQRANCSAE